jgi:hypothetical protein
MLEAVPMPFDAATVGLVEDALSESFNFHNALDNFLTRSGVSSRALKLAREAAELRIANSNREYERAPKRFVVQELLSLISTDRPEGDRIIATIVTGLIDGSFPQATPAAKGAIEALTLKRKNDSAERERHRREESDKQEAARKTVENAKTQAFLTLQAQRDGFRDRFIGLMDEGNAQTRGYLLESFLNDFFEFEKLDPRKSFRLKSEQIDGSISWRNKTCFVEAKWVKEPVTGADFGAFNYKIEGKTVDTRGLYISVNGYSQAAIQGMNAKGALKFVCIDGAHIMRAVSTNDGLQSILNKVWRHADETGESYLPVSKF